MKAESGDTTAWDQSCPKPKPPKPKVQSQNSEKKTKKQNNKKIPTTFDYCSVEGLSNEVKEKLNHHKPRTIGDANIIEGVTPAAINLILIYLKKAELLEQNA